MTIGLGKRVACTYTQTHGPIKRARCFQAALQSEVGAAWGGHEPGATPASATAAAAIGAEPAHHATTESTKHHAARPHLAVSPGKGRVVAVGHAVATQEKQICSAVPFDAVQGLDVVQQDSVGCGKGGGGTTAQ